MPEHIPPSEGRAAFGRQSVPYERARPDYPARVYELLVAHCGLSDGCRTIEVGAGSGQVSKRLVELGARPLVAVEPDRGFEKALQSLVETTAGAVVPLYAPFESASVENGAFDLAVCATSFHWLDREIGPPKLGACLRAGGWLVLFWNVFGDPRQPDPFHEVTAPLLAGLARSPSHARRGTVPFALDREARASDFSAAQADRDFTVEEVRWTLTLDPEQVRALYSTWASISRLPHARREALLDRIESIAESQFGGVVERKMVTPIYLGRRVG